MSTTSLSEYQSCDNSQLAEPFQVDDANVIIRAGGVDFPAHRFILARVSPVFKDKFSLPCGDTIMQERTPVIEVEEDAKTIHNILSILYFGNDNPVSYPFSEIQSMLLAAHKYSMDKIQMAFEKPLKGEACKDPVRVFVLACKAGLPEVARAAAMQTLTWDFVTLATCDILEVSQLHTSTVLKLLRYHRNCGEVASKVIASLTEETNYNSKCPVAKHEHPIARDWELRRLDCREWWIEYIDRIKTDSKTRPLNVAYKDLQFLNKCCRNAHTCRLLDCQNALYHLMKAGELLERGVREAVAEVQLELDDNDFVI